MKVNKLLKIILFILSTMILLSCSKQQKVVEIKQEKLNTKSDKIVKLSDFEVVNFQNGSFLVSKSKNDGEIYFLKLIDNNLEVVAKRIEPQYIDYYGKYKDKNIMVYTEGNV